VLNGALVGDVNLDGTRTGVLAALEAVGIKDTVGSLTATVSQTYLLSLSAAPHTVKLQAEKISGAGSATAYMTNTGFTYTLLSA
jgi:hypothetical protein